MSHDRYFISKLATRILDLGVKPALDYMGTYDEYARYRAINKQKTAETAANEVITDAKEQYLRNKEQAAEQRRRQTRVRKNAEETAKLEKELEKVIAEQSDESKQSDYMHMNELYERQTAIEARLMELYEEAEGFDKD